MSIDLVAGIVRILRPDGSTSGAGFVVSKSGLIATCSHVIQSQDSQSRGEERPDKVKVVFNSTGDELEARMLPDWWRDADHEDVAILQLEGDLPAGIQSLPLGPSAGTSNHEFKTYGFPDARSDGGLWGYGVIGDSLNEEAGRSLLQLTGTTEVSPGFSGAPVLDILKRRVVGMITAITAPNKFGRLAETAFITTTETLQAICPELQFSDICPYMGLSSFEEKDAEFFFGRKREVQRLVESLKHEPRFLAVMGPSGSGKSSVIQAGLIPKLRKGAVPGSDRWGIITARPGDRPVQNLEAEGLKGASSGLADAVQGWLAGHPDKSRLMVILDQFEELLATASPQVRQDFLNQLKDLLDSDLSLTLVIVMRDDFFGRFGEEPPSDLFEWVQSGFVHISASLEEDELAEIIKGPAQKVHLQFEEGLVEVIAKDAMETTAEGERASRSTVLPLLEFALTELWMRRNDGFLTHEAYNAIGGVTGGLTQWADQAYQSLAKDGLGDVTRRVLTDLVNLGIEGPAQDSKRLRTLDDLARDPEEQENVREVVRKLANARLITTSFDKQNNLETAEIIHDSLIHGWSRLRRWLKEDRTFLAWKREIERKAKSWEETSADESKREEGRLLYGRRDLGEAENWLKERGRDLGSEKRFLEASLEREERERREEEKRKKRKMQYLAGFLVVALAISAVAVFEWIQADQNKEEALALYLTSLSTQVKTTFASDYDRQILLAVESLRHKEMADGDLALRRSIALQLTPLAQLDHNGTVLAMAFSPDGSKVLTGSDGGTARIWNVTNGEKLRELHHEGWVSAVAFSPDGSKVLTGSDDGMARIWNVTNGEKPRELLHKDSVLAVAFSPDSSKVLTGDVDGMARIWNVANGEMLRELHLEGGVMAVAFSPDGSRVLTGTHNGIAQIWNVANGEVLRELHHEGQVEAAAFSPDGSKVLTGSDDGMAQIWNVANRQELHKLPHHGSVLAVAFSPHGSIVRIGCDDGMVRIWPVSYEDLINLACNCVEENLTIEEWKKYEITSVRTCPREGSFNQSLLVRLRTDPMGFLTGSAECQTCIGPPFDAKYLTV